MLLNMASLLRRENERYFRINAAFLGIMASPEGPEQLPGKGSPSERGDWGNAGLLARVTVILLLS